MITTSDFWIRFNQRHEEAEHPEAIHALPKLANTKPPEDSKASIRGSRGDRFGAPHAARPSDSRPNGWAAAGQTLLRPHRPVRIPLPGPAGSSRPRWQVFVRTAPDPVFSDRQRSLSRARGEPCNDLQVESEVLRA